MVITDEERMFQDGWTEVKLYRCGGENFVHMRERSLCDTFVDFKPASKTKLMWKAENIMSTRILDVLDSEVEHCEDLTLSGVILTHNFWQIIIT